MRVKPFLIVALSTGLGTVAMWSITSTALPLSWMYSDASIRIGNATAYPGCAPATVVDDVSAVKLAVIHAKANLARSKKVTLSGKEHSVTAGKNVDYSFTITETADATVGSVIVLEKQLAVIDNILQLCVLIVE